MQVNYGLGEKTKGPWMSEYVNFVHGIDRVLIVRETWFGYDCLKIIPQSWFVERDTKTVRDYVYSHYPFIQAEHKGKFETYLRDEINNHIGKLVVLHFTIPDTSAPKHGTGSGTSSDLQTLENKSQNINSMTNIDRIVLLLALTFHKMGKNIFDSFSMSDLYMIAGMFVIWAGSQFFGVGEVIDAALLAWLWWTIGWDCWRFLVIIINSVKTAIQATSIQQIDDAASQLAPAAAALGIDALMGFILHKFGKGSAVEEAAKKEIKTEEDLVEHKFGQNANAVIPKKITTVNQDYLKEMAQNGVKFSPDDILRVEKLPDGRIVFLEKGNPSAGLQHIIERHGADFSKIGVSEEKIPDVIMDAIKGNPVGYQGKGVGRPIYETIIDGQRQHIAITTGNNGFIVGANPAGGIK